MMTIDEESQLLKLKRRLCADRNTEILSADDNLLRDFLESAKNEIMARRYPFGDFPNELDVRYADLQIRIAVVMYNKIGAEGETGHNENGISRSYESYNALLSEVVPLVGGIR